MANTHINTAQGIASKSTSALNGIDFGNLIGAPLSACVTAQAQAARTTVDFVRDVGFNKNTKTGNMEAIYINFSYVNQGRMVTLAVPLLTIVPVPYIAIRTVDIKFTCTVNGVESTSDSELDTEHGYDSSSSSSVDIDRSSSKQYNWSWGGAGRNTSSSYSRDSSSMRTSVSTKRDSASTRDSQFSIEATIDVEVHAEGGTMPAGMAKVLEMLSSSLDMRNPDGELTVNATTLTIADATPALLVVQYKNPDGIFTVEKDEVSVKFGDTEIDESAVTRDKKMGTITYKLSQVGEYTVEAGEQKETVTVVAKQA